MTAEDQNPALELELARLRGEVLVRLTEIGGQLTLLAQRAESAAARADEQARAADARAAAQAKQIELLDGRLDTVERTQVTRADMDERSRRTLAWTVLIVTIVSALTSTGATVVIAIVNK